MPHGPSTLATFVPEHSIGFSSQREAAQNRSACEGECSSELRPAASPAPLGSSKLAERGRRERFVSHLGEQIRDRLDYAGRAVGVPVDIVANRRARQDENRVHPRF
jgi:hypothetical protein